MVAERKAFLGPHFRFDGGKEDVDDHTGPPIEMIQVGTCTKWNNKEWDEVRETKDTEEDLDGGCLRVLTQHRVYPCRLLLCYGDLVITLFS